MVQFYSRAFSYEHPWSFVNMGIWRKYPNPHSAHVLSVDILERSVDPETGIIRTERVIGCTQKAPGWIVRLLGGTTQAYVREITHLDPRTMMTRITSVNLSLSQYMTVIERITYSPDRLDPQNRTTFAQTAEIQAKMPKLPSIEGTLERYSLDVFGKNAEKGRVGFEHVLQTLWESRQRIQQAQ